MYYVAYEDKGPSLPCGQSIECTRWHNDLYIFNREEDAREFIKNIHKIPRISPKIVGFWSDEMGNVLKGK
jgi:hypothetical protein